jgi:hypothetical protein
MLSLTYNGLETEIKRIKTRGNSALYFKRKSYSVSLEDPIQTQNYDGIRSKMLKRFKLLALARIICTSKTELHLAFWKMQVFFL